MRISVRHTTRYRYSEEVTYSAMALRLTPQSYDGHSVIDWRVSSQPEASLVASRDGFGNDTHLLCIDTPHTQMTIEARGIVEVTDRNGIVAGLAENVPLRVYQRVTRLTAASPQIQDFAAAITADGPLPYLHALMGALHEQITYLPGATDSETTAADAFAAGKGVCQDHTHIFLAAARSRAIPCRYVTGYLVTAEADAAAHHAWAEAWLDGLGWVGFDVANCMCPTDHYVRLASALDARHAAPVRGARRGGAEEVLEVGVAVAQVQIQQQQQQSQSQS